LQRYCQDRLVEKRRSKRLLLKPEQPSTGMYPNRRRFCLHPWPDPGKRTGKTRVVQKRTKLNPCTSFLKILQKPYITQNSLKTNNFKEFSDVLGCRKSTLAHYLLILQQSNTTIETNTVKSTVVYLLLLFLRHCPAKEYKEYQ